MSIPPKHDHATIAFPKHFLWGSATSAYQVEGDNIYTDWWEWEQTHQPPHLRSGKAAQQYHLYEQDFQLAKKLSHNAHRLSIEWSRIEPYQGEFQLEAIDHYKKVLKSLKEKQMKVMLTLWHFTLPKWVADQGGWENPQTINYFINFLEKVVPQLKDYVDFWITLNEPTVYIFHHYIDPRWPGAKKAWFGRRFLTLLNFANAHKKSYKLIHKIDPGKPVGFAHNVQSFEAYHKHFLTEQLAVLFGNLASNHSFYFLTQGHHDFLGLNYYIHTRFNHNLFQGLVKSVIDAKEQARDVSDLGWEIHPEGIFDVLTDLADHLPIYITECGIASTNDDRRTRFLITYLQEVYRAVASGVDVRGFFYWSLIDNFEWHRGFDPRFGLIEIDYKNQERRIRPSAYVYKKIIESNGIPHSLLKLLGHGMKVEEVL